MNKKFKFVESRRICLICVCLLALSLVSGARAQVAQQVLLLSPGWNSVWLEVEPRYADGHERAGSPMAPEDVFATQAAVDIVASPKPLSGVGEFFASGPTNGTSAVFNQEGWAQWHRTGGPLDDLIAMPGNRPYLINCSGFVFMVVQGNARFFRPTWTPDRYNLIGFGLEAASPPSFSQFFDAAETRHPLGKIYRMDTAGNWSVVAPGSAMKNNEAYWVFSSGPSDFMGPVAIDFDGAILGELNFGGPADVVDVTTGVATQALDLEEVTFAYLGTNTALPRLALQSNLAYPSQSPGDLTLYEVNPVPNSLAYQRGAVIGANFVSSDAPLSVVNRIGYLTIGAHRNWSSGRSDRVHLHRLRTGAGTEFWLPVRVRHNDLQVSGELPPAVPGQPDPLPSGLWVGEIIADQVSAIDTNGAAARPAAASAPLRLMLHSDSNGVVRLLSQVTIMQTRSADPDVEAEPVLVVDAARIPFYEGISERRGKRVGVRLESVAFDMPRKLDPVSQADLLATTNLTGEAAIRDYLESRKSRPPSLAETYHLAWPLDGFIGAGQTVQTVASAPLRLDPFHRANPFRHVFHQDHPRGPSITRTLEIIFEAESAAPGFLGGRYKETIAGLTKGIITITGTVQLRQVSAVASLEGVE